MGTIDPEKLRGQLYDLWVSLGRESGAEGQGVMRACALTLITATDEDNNPEATVETVARLMREHPSRAIIIRLTPGDEDLLEADVEARCWMPFGARQQICCEQIVIRCSEKTLGEVPGVILPLLAADLPVVLWCASERVWQSEVFPRLAGLAGRIILDTFRLPRPGEALAALAVEYRKERALVTDLSWTRTTRWRALLAQVFENELYRRQIPHFCALTLCYEAAEPGRIPPTALLLAGWIIGRLGWPWESARRDAEDLDTLLFRYRNGEARLSFHRQQSEFLPGRMAALELAAQRDPATRITIARSGPAFVEVRAEVEGLEPVVNRVSFPPSAELMLLGEELAIHAPDPAFEQGLERAIYIARTLGRP